MENKSKAETLIGFAIKAGKCKIGTNAIGTLKKADLIIVCKSASMNTQKQAESYGLRFHAPVMISVEKPLEQITHKENAKMLAITDKGFAKSIIDLSQSQFIFQSQENK